MLPASASGFAILAAMFGLRFRDFGCTVRFLPSRLWLPGSALNSGVYVFPVFLRL